MDSKNKGNLHVNFKIKDGKNMAGIKTVMTYPSEKIQYVSLKKSEATSSMIHVVNDKKPGQLIVVMASATGQGSADYALFSIDFTLSGSLPVTLRTTKIEMMSEDLKDITCPTRDYVID